MIRMYARKLPCSPAAAVVVVEVAGLGLGACSSFLDLNNSGKRKHKQKITEAVWVVELVEEVEEVTST